MKRIRALIIVSLAVILTFAIIGCTAAPGSLLFGKWEPSKVGGYSADKMGKKWKDYNTIEFLKDGTLISPGGSSFKYRVIDETRLELDSGMGKKVIKYAVSQNELMLEMDMGNQDKFVRAKN